MTQINNDLINNAKQLFSKSFTQEANEAKETMELFDELYKNNSHNEEVAFIYSKALLNLVEKLQTFEAVATVEKLEKLLQEHKNSQNIAVRYARGLANLIYQQTAEDAASSINRLKILQLEYSDNSEVASGYVGGLVNYTIKGLNSDEAIRIINSLIDQFKDDEGFIKFSNNAVNVLKNKEINR